MRKVVIYILVLTSLFSCAEKTSETKISEKLIDLICEEKIKQSELLSLKDKIHIKPKYSIDVFVKLNNDKFVNTDFNELLEVYEKGYTSKFDSFNEFMYEVINNDFVLNENELGAKAFHLDKDLNNEFKNSPFEDFLKKYSFKKKDDKRLYLKNNTFSGDKHLSVSYLLYAKGYYLGGGCLGDGIKIYKIEDLLKK